jgi:hypothetical protein
MPLRSAGIGVRVLDPNVELFRECKRFHRVRFRKERDTQALKAKLVVNHLRAIVTPLFIAWGYYAFFL